MFTTVSPFRSCGSKIIYLRLNALLCDALIGLCMIFFVAPFCFVVVGSIDHMEELVSGLQGPPGIPGRGRPGRPGPAGRTGPQGTCMNIMGDGLG